MFYDHEDPSEKKILKAEMYASNNNIYHLPFVRPQNLWKINNSLFFADFREENVIKRRKKSKFHWATERWTMLCRKLKKKHTKTDLINLLKMFKSRYSS